MSYGVPQGSKFGVMEMTDKIYDGLITSANVLYGGVGQLNDGRVGGSLETMAKPSVQHWVGWSNKSVGKW